MFFNFLKYTRIYFLFSGLFMLASIVLLLVFGLRPGIEFTGGSILEVEFLKERPSSPEIRERLKDLNLEELLLQPTGERGLILKTKEISEETHQKILDKLEREKVRELRFESIGPTIGKELREKTKTLAIFALLAILIYIAFAFRKLAQPRRPWQYGVVAIIALFHDVLIPLGLFAFLGRFFNVPFTIPIAVALLTIVGYSVNDTVIIFDRIRENLFKRRTDSFKEVINFSLNQILVRSINTSLTTLFVLLAIFFLGGETLKYFSLALIIGIGAGTYSSIFLAAPLLFSWSETPLRLRKRKRA